MKLNQPKPQGRPLLTYISLSWKVPWVVCCGNNTKTGRKEHATCLWDAAVFENILISYFHNLKTDSSKQQWCFLPRVPAEHVKVKDEFTLLTKRYLLYLVQKYSLLIKTTHSPWPNDLNGIFDIFSKNKWYFGINVKTKYIARYQIENTIRNKSRW